MKSNQKLREQLQHYRRFLPWIPLTELLKIILASGDVGFLASRGGGGRCYLIYINGTWTIGYGGSFTGGGSLSLGVRYRVESVLHDGWQSITANGTVQKTATYSGAVDSGCNLHVFRTNNNNSNGGATKARLYSLTLSRMGTLLRDYVPCTTNGAGALYDRVSSALLPTLGGTLAPGPDLQS